MQVFIGNLDSSAEELLKRYLSKFYPDAVIERLKATVIKGKIKNQGARPTTILIILDRNLYDRCKGFADEVLSLPKTHLYESESSFREFLKARFGCDESELDSVVAEQGYVHTPVTNASDLGFSSNNEIELGMNSDNSSSVSTSGTNLVENSNSDDALLIELKSKLKEAEERAAHFESELVTARTKLNNIATTEKGIKDAQRDLNVAQENISSLQEQLSLKDDKIQELESDLSTARSDIADVNDRLNEQKSYIDGLEIVSKRYNTIFPELENYKSRCAELEAKLKAFDNVTLSDDSESYDTVKSERDGLRVEVDFLHEQISLKTKEVEEIKKSAKQNVVDEIARLKSDLEEATSRADLLKTSVDNKDSRIRELVKDLTQARADMDTLRDDVEASDTLLANKTSDLEEATSTIESLNKSLKDLKIEMQDFEETKHKLIDAELDIENLKTQIADFDRVQADLNTAQESIAELNSRIEDLSSKLSESESKADSYLSKKNELSDKVKELEVQLGTAQSNKDELESTRNLLEASRNTVTELTTSIGVLKDKLEESEDLSKTLQSKLDKQATANNDIVKELEDERFALKTQLETANADLKLSEERAVQANLLVEDFKSQLARSQSEATGYADQLKLEREGASTLREQLGEVQVKLQAYEQTAETVESLQSKVADLETELISKTNDISTLNEEKEGILADRDSKQFKINELEAMIESFSADKATYDGTISGKNAEIAKLKAQLKAFSESAVSTDSADALKIQLESALSLNEQLKNALEESANNLTSLKEASESRLKAALDTNKSLRQKINLANKAKEGVVKQLTALKKNPYYLLSTSSESLSMLPKPISLGNVFYNNIFCFASGSGESIDELFSLFQRQVALNAKKSFLIIDLSVESALLKYFNIATVPSPDKWLMNDEPLVNCVASCPALRNLRVVSTGFNYFNTLCLLRINWSKKLEELKGLADYVFINVGCLIDNIGAILFDAFLSVMNGHIIIRGTPQAIRSVTLRVVAMQNKVNALVSSIRVEIEEKEGVSYQKELKKLQQFYDTLGSYCDLSVITSKDILEI